MLKPVQKLYKYRYDLAPFIERAVLLIRTYCRDLIRDC